MEVSCRTSGACWYPCWKLFFFVDSEVASFPKDLRTAILPLEFTATAGHRRIGCANSAVVFSVPDRMGLPLTKSRILRAALMLQYPCQCIRLKKRCQSGSPPFCLSSLIEMSRNKELNVILHNPSPSEFRLIESPCEVRCQTLSLYHRFIGIAQYWVPQSLGPDRCRESVQRRPH